MLIAGPALRWSRSLRSKAHKPTHTHTHTHTHAHKHAFNLRTREAHTLRHADRQTRTDAHKPRHMRARTQAHSGTNTHSGTKIHIHTQTRARRPRTLGDTHASASASASKHERTSQAGAARLCARAVLVALGLGLALTPFIPALVPLRDVAARSYASQHVATRMYGHCLPPFLAHAPVELRPKPLLVLLEVLCLQGEPRVLTPAFGAVQSWIHLWPAGAEGTVVPCRGGPNRC